MAIGLLGCLSPARGQFVVNSLTDSGAGSGTTGDLRYTINQANAAGSAATITFNISGGGTITLGSMLPILTNPNGISIDGANGGLGAIIISGGSSSATTGDRIFFIGVNPSDATGVSGTDATTWSISNLTLQDGNARGGAGGDGGNTVGAGAGGGAGLGGAIFLNAGSLTLSGVAFSDNRATGGDGGAVVASADQAAGGGGGMGGAGGAGGSNDSGGGGGFGLGAAGGAGAASGSAGVFTGGLSGGAGSGVGAGAGGASGGGGGGSGSSQNGGGGGPGGESAGTAPGQGGGAGGFGGGGGGGGGNSLQNGGIGGYGGGGGAGGNGSGGAGGFGGGGGGGAGGGSAGFGAGAGGDSYGGGGGGSGLGGAIFVRQGAAVTMAEGGFSGGTVSGGSGANGGDAGSGIGSAAFLAGSAIFSVGSGNTVTIANTIGGGTDALITGGFSKSGAGTLELSGANSYVGNTTVSAGTLRVNGSTDASSPVTIAAAGTLQGTGTVNGTVEVNGILEAGTDTTVATLTTGSQSWKPGGSIRLTYDPTIATPVAGTDNDLVRSTAGSLNLSAISTGSRFGIIMEASGVGSIDTASYVIGRFPSGTTALPGGASASDLTGYFDVNGDVPGIPLVSLVTGGGFDELTLSFSPNQPPTFEMGDKIELTAGAANIPQTYLNWVYDISPGSGESGQNVTFDVIHASGVANLFSADPAVATDGTLTFTWNGNVGSASYAIYGTDDGGGGMDTSFPHYFDVAATASGISILPQLIEPGDFVVADRGPYLGTGKILLIRGPDSLGGEPGTQRVLSTQLTDPYGVAMDFINGDIYVADYETLSPGSAGGIYKLDPSTLDLTLFSQEPNDFVTPFDIVVDPSDGSIYVADLDAYTTGAIFRVDPLDGSVSLVAQTSDFFWLRGIAIDFSNSMLYVSDSGNPSGSTSTEIDAKIFEIDLTQPTPIPPTIIAQGGNLSKPTGLNVDVFDGFLFIAEAENQMILSVDLTSSLYPVSVVSDNTMGSNDYIRPTHVVASFCGCLLYVTDGKAGAASGERRLYEVDRLTGEATILTQDGFFDQPRGLIEVSP